MSVTRKPARWQSSDAAIKAVQVAFDVEEKVLETVRRTAFEANRSTSDQIRHLLGLPTAGRPKRPRLTVTLSSDDYILLGQRYGLEPEEHLAIKEAATRELIAFVPPQMPGKKK